MDYNNDGNQVKSRVVPLAVKRLIIISFVINIILVIFYFSVLVAQKLIVTLLTGRAFPNVNFQIPVITTFEVIFLFAITTILFVLIIGKDNKHFNKGMAILLLLVSGIAYFIKMFASGILNGIVMRQLATKGVEFIVYRSAMSNALYYTQPFYTMVVMLNLIALSILLYSFNANKNNN